jgi:hypothetical protein
VRIGPASIRADVLAAALLAASWQIRSAGTGAKGPRWYQWAYLHLEEEPPFGGQRYLLIRRNRNTGELAFYRCWAPQPVALDALVATAGIRWKVEAFQSGKALVGLDEHQVRRYTSWQRWTVLAMLAHAFLTITTAEQPEPQTASSLLPFTRNEIRHLLATLTVTIPHRPDHRWSWSAWRRRHQLGAKHCHYQRRESCWT